MATSIYNTNNSIKTQLTSSPSTPEGSLRCPPAVTVAVKIDTEGCAVVIGLTADDCEVGVVDVDEVTGRIGTSGAKGLGTDVVGDVTISVMEKAVTDAVSEASSLSVIGAGKKFGLCEMQIVD